jgi:hypothetical protein
MAAGARTGRSSSLNCSLMEESGSHMTRCWSKGDSNSRSHRERSGHGRAPHNHRTIARERSLSFRHLSSTARGTGSSNPLCSSGESRANLTFRGAGPNVTESARPVPRALPSRGNHCSSARSGDRRTPILDDRLASAARGAEWTERWMRRVVLLGINTSIQSGEQLRQHLFVGRLGQAKSSSQTGPQSLTSARQRLSGPSSPRCGLRPVGW